MTGTEITLCAVGDVMLHERYDALAAAGRAAWVLDPFAALVSGADVVAGNLECVPSTLGTPRDDKLCLRADPAYLEALAGAGFSVLGLANNHGLDFGAEALLDVRARLAALGVATVGAGRDLAEARAPAILERGGRKVGFLAYCDASTGATLMAGPDTPGVAPLDRGLVLEDIARWRGQVDHLVLLLHWGLEYVPYPTPEQARLARDLVAAGAWLILGHHSHVLHGLEPQAAGLVAYSLGNFTDAAVDWQGPLRPYSAPLREADRESALLTVTLAESGVVGHGLLPLWLDDDGRPGPAPAERAERIERLVAERSRGLDPEALERHWASAVVGRRVWGPLQAWWASGTLLDKVRRFNPGQVHSLFVLLRTYLRVRFSRSATRWSLINPRNDRRPMPYAGDDADRLP